MINLNTSFAKQLVHMVNTTRDVQKASGTPAEMLAPGFVAFIEHAIANAPADNEFAALLRETIANG